MITDIIRAILFVALILGITVLIIGVKTMLKEHDGSR